MRRLLWAVLVAILGALPAAAETVVLGLSQHEVAITTESGLNKVFRLLSGPVAAIGGRPAA